MPILVSLTKIFIYINIFYLQKIHFKNLEIEFNVDDNNLRIDDLLLYEISFININDTFAPTKIYGSYKGYCFKSSCIIRNLRCKCKLIDAYYKMFLLLLLLLPIIKIIKIIMFY